MALPLLLWGGTSSASFKILMWPFILHLGDDRITYLEKVFGFVCQYKDEHCSVWVPLAHFPVLRGCTNIGHIIHADLYGMCLCLPLDLLCIGMNLLMLGFNPHTFRFGLGLVSWYRILGMK